MRIDADVSLCERVSPLYKIRYILIIRVRFTSEFFFEHGFIGLTRMLRFCGGTVFQTALLFMVIVPRLRPGLLSLTLGTGFQPNLAGTLHGNHQ